MRLTERDVEMLKLLPAARWLTTGQVRRRFFRRATVGAARRRLRLLAAAGYVTKRQENRMREALFTLGRTGKRFLEANGADAVSLERQPPKQWEHLTGINEVRIAAELAGALAYFFAAWELPAAGWRSRIIPDAVFRLAGRTFALEYDRGLENLQYFVGSKIAAYRRGLPGLSLAGVLIVVDRDSRKETLTRAIGEAGTVGVATLSAIREHGIANSLGKICPPELSSRKDRFSRASDSASIC